MTIAQFLTALAAKVAGLGVAAKAALGLGLATASVATAGAAGVLPDPAQHAVATVVNSATPVDIPDAPDDAAGKAQTFTGANAPATVGQNGSGDDATGGNDDQAPDNHGACVSAIAKSAPTGAGGVHGRAVSEAAKSCPKPSTANAGNTKAGNTNAGNTKAGHDDETVTTAEPTSTTLEPSDTSGGSSDGATQGTEDHGQDGQSHGNRGGAPGKSAADHGR